MRERKEARISRITFRFSQITFFCRAKTEQKQRQILMVVKGKVGEKLCKKMSLFCLFSPFLAGKLFLRKVKFYVRNNTPGIGADARVQAEINATLKQFSNIKNVVILTKDGHCFADEIGNDRCLR